MNCPDCPLGPDRPCRGEPWHVERLCRLLDPSNPAHDPRYAEVVRTLDREHRSPPPTRPAYPSAATMAGTALAAAGRFVGAVATGAPAFVPAEVLEARRAACASCPKFVAEADRCELCGCYLRIKRTLATESCPLPDPKWRAIHGDDCTDDRAGP